MWCGRTCRGRTVPAPIARWDDARDAWVEDHRTDLISGRSAVFLETWPRSGSMRSGVIFGRPTWEPRTAGSESLLLLPTVTVQDGQNTGGPAEFIRNTPPLNTRVLMLPTPSANLGDNGGSQNPDKRRAGGHQPSIADVAEHKLMPTPQAHDAQQGRASDAAKGGPNQRGSKGYLMLPSAVTLLPTVRAQNGEDRNQMGGHERRGGSRWDELLLKGQLKQIGQNTPPPLDDGKLF